MIPLDSIVNDPAYVALLTTIRTWIEVAQALVGTVGVLAFVLAFLYKMAAIDSRAVNQSKQWIQRIVVGTIGVEVAGSLATLLTHSVSGAPR